MCMLKVTFDLFIRNKYELLNESNAIEKPFQQRKLETCRWLILYFIPSQKKKAIKCRSFHVATEFLSIKHSNDKHIFIWCIEKHNSPVLFYKYHLYKGVKNIKRKNMYSRKCWCDNIMKKNKIYDKIYLRFRQI